MIAIGAMLLSVACFASFGWAITRLFTRPEGRTSVTMKWLSALGTIFFGSQILALAIPAQSLVPALQYAGLTLFAIALGLFWWAVPFARQARLHVAFAPSQPHTILDRGPYRLIRHPFYASYSAFWLAGLLVSQQWFVLPSVVVMIGFYLCAIRQEESAFLESGLADRYRSYCRVTGSFLPRFSRPGGPR